MKSWVNNDTVALVFLGSVALCGVFFRMENVTIGAMSAIGGYIGAKIGGNDSRGAV